MPGFVTVDRIENGVAVLEYPDRKTREIPVSMLPEGAEEGSVLEILSGGGLSPSKEETSRRRELNRDLFNSLLEDTTAD